MGVNRSAPWWLTWLLTFGIAVFLIGERLLASSETPRTIVMVLAGLIVLGAIVWRVRSWQAAEGEARGVEQILLLAYVGCALALVVHVASTQHGIDWLGLTFEDDEARTRYRRMLQVAWAILLSVSILPALTAQFSIGAFRHTQGLAAGLEGLRFKETAGAGLTVALACSSLFLLYFTVSERDRSVDMSYFKTSAPGTATSNIAASFDEPLRVDLFFPNVSDVKEEALRYFNALAQSANDNVRITEHDRLAVPKLAEELQVTADGTIVLRKGERTQRVTIGDSMDVSRVALRKLDADVQTMLMLLLRDKRAAYLTRGHGEINDTLSATSRANRELRGTMMTTRLLSGMNYDEKPLGLQNGLGQKIPDDAAVVAVLGPQTAFLPEELATLDRYLAGGGRLLLALDPDTEFELGPLEQRLGIRFQKVELADDVQHLRNRDVPSDRRLILTDRFSVYNDISPTLSMAAGNAVMFAGAGSLELADTTLAHVSFLVRSLSSTFDDKDGDYEFDTGAETKQERYLVAAIEGKPQPVQAPLDSGAAAPVGAAIDTAGMRAIVIADAEAFTDPVLEGSGLNTAMVNDGLKWLGREEGLGGTTVSELDVPIQHTQSEDVLWFYSIILGAPLLVLGFGLGGVIRRQKRRGGEA